MQQQQGLEGVIPVPEAAAAAEAAAVAMAGWSPAPLHTQVALMAVMGVLLECLLRRLDQVPGLTAAEGSSRVLQSTQQQQGLQTQWDPRARPLVSPATLTTAIARVSSHRAGNNAAAAAERQRLLLCQQCLW
jgi:hypothetical protein